MLEQEGCGCGERITRQPCLTNDVYVPDNVLTAERFKVAMIVVHGIYVSHNCSVLDRTIIFPLYARP